jgi:hypothetical protein
MDDIKIAETTRWMQSGTNNIVMNTSTGRYYHLNESGNFLWSALISRASQAEIETQLRLRYAIPPEQARLDASKFLAKIYELGLVERDPKVAAGEA